MNMDICIYIIINLIRWHCFVGRHFASYCTHEKGKYMYFLFLYFNYIKIDIFILDIMVFVYFHLVNFLLYYFLFIIQVIILISK